LYKNALGEGGAPRTVPSAFDFTATAKYHALVEMGKLDKEDAQEQYVAYVQALIEQGGSGDDSGGGENEDDFDFAPSQSTLGMVEEAEGTVYEVGEGQDLRDAAAATDLKRIKQLVERRSRGKKGSEKGLVNDGDSNKQTPLHFAIDRGSAECANFLIEKGADVDAGDADGTTPLHMAVLNDDEAMVRLLVKSGADPDKKDNDGESAREGAPRYFI
jgi:hypothetical protein